MSLLSKIPRTYKLWVKAQLVGARIAFVRAVLSYDAGRLLAALRSVGVQSGDSIMLHGSFEAHHGFRGSVDELTNVFVDAVGPDGNLLMVSMPYRTSTLEYLARMRTFDVKRTPSMMGLISEHFRRRADVLRSAHPTHPVLARGPRAEWFLVDHPACIYPCGPETPFEKLARVDGKAVFFNAGFDTFTFFHYLEHVVHADLPFSLYTDQLFELPVIDERGERKTVATHAFSADAISRRRPLVLESALRARGAFRECRVGNSRLLVVRVRDTIECVEEMSRRGAYFYDMSVHA